jgi:hypothetical protein
MHAREQVGVGDVLELAQSSACNAHWHWPLLKDKARTDIGQVGAHGNRTSNAKAVTDTAG